MTHSKGKQIEVADLSDQNMPIGSPINSKNSPEANAEADGPNRLSVSDKRKNSGRRGNKFSFSNKNETGDVSDYKQQYRNKMQQQKNLTA